jgi:hypothetical protein
MAQTRSVGTEEVSVVLCEAAKNYIENTNNKTFVKAIECKQFSIISRFIIIKNNEATIIIDQFTSKEQI